MHVWKVVGPHREFHLRLERVVYVNSGADPKFSESQLDAKGSGWFLLCPTDGFSPSFMAL